MRHPRLLPSEWRYPAHCDCGKKLTKEPPDMTAMGDLFCSWRCHNKHRTFEHRLNRQRIQARPARL